MKIVTKIFLAIFMLFGVSGMPVVAMQPEDVKLEANDFSLSLSDIATLTVEESKDEQHGNVVVLNQKTREYLIPFIVVNEEEWNTLKTADTIGVFPLTFILKHVNYDTSTTINVTVTEVNQNKVKQSELAESEKPKTTVNSTKAIIFDVLKLSLGAMLIIIGIVFVKRRKLHN